MAAIEPDHARLPLVLSIDAGTSSLRVVVYDAGGQPVRGIEARERYESRATPAGGNELDPQELFAAFERAVDACLQRAGVAARQIRAVGMSCFWHGLMGIDERGEPLTPIYTWADTRSSEAARALCSTLDQRAIHARTGAVLHSSYFPAKLVWLHQTQLDLFSRVWLWLSLGEYAYLQLFGEARESISMASGTGLFDQHAKTWDLRLLDSLPVTVEQLPPLGDVDTPLTGLRQAYAERWPSLAAIPWVLPAGDGGLSNIGSGCVSPERIALMIGTSGAMRVLWKANDVKIPESLWCYRADAERFVMGGALSNGGNLFAWLQDTLRFEDVQRAEERLLTAVPDGHGLTMLPFLAGERSPDWNAEVRGAIAGLHSSTTPGDILQASLESVAYRFALIHRLLCQALPQAEDIVATGAALLSSPAWMQILADVLNRPLLPSVEMEASSRGAALQALQAIGHLDDLPDVVETSGAPYRPRPAAHEIYARAIERHERLYRLMTCSALDAG
jgi:gluconokinase